MKPAATLDDLIVEQLDEQADEERETKARRSSNARKGGGRKAGTTSMFPYGRRLTDEQKIAINRTPEWAGKRPGQHPALPLRPPGRS